MKLHIFYCRILGGCKEASAPLYCLSPTDNHKLLVQDPNLSNAVQQEIKDLKKKYPKWQIITSVIEPVLKSQPGNLPIYTVHLDNNSRMMPYYLHMNAFSANEKTHMATVGTFVKDDMCRRRGVIYGATAAHALLNSEQQRYLSDYDTCNPETIKVRIREVCAAVVARTSLDEQLSISPHSHQPVPIRDSPFLCFCHMIPTPENGQSQLRPFQKFTSDIVLLPVDADNLDREAVTENSAESFLASVTDHPSINEVDRPLIHTPVAGYIDIKSTEDIDRLRIGRVRIIIEGIWGELIQQPKTFTRATFGNLVHPGQSNRREMAHIPKHMIAPHFAFTTKKA